MSQQINLLLPELLPKRDYLSLAVIAPLVVAAVVLVAVSAFWLQAEQRALIARDGELANGLKLAQQRLGDAGKAKSERKSDPALAQKVQRLQTAQQWRREALQVLQAGSQGESISFSATMAGLARQATEGLWLTAFAIQGGGLELSGRMLDISLLPVYIHRLNAEPAFQGRRFAELDMKGVTPEEREKPSLGATPLPNAKGAASLPRYTEFTLRAIAALPGTAHGGGER